MWRPAVPMVMLATFSLVGCGGSDKRSAQIVRARQVDKSTIVVNIDACNAESNTVSLRETENEMHVTVRTDDPPGGPECSDGVKVRFSSPVGTRQLVDGSTGETVVVER